jgi:hypothetical protein
MYPIGIGFQGRIIAFLETPDFDFFSVLPKILGQLHKISVPGHQDPFGKGIDLVHAINSYSNIMVGLPVDRFAVLKNFEGIFDFDLITNTQ